MPDSNPIDYYAAPGLLTRPGKYASLFDGLPASVPELCQVVQGLVVHIFWAQRYGLNLSPERRQEVNLRSVEQKLSRLLELDTAPLTVERPPDRKLVGNCRDFSLMLVAMLRHQSVPARARCGFGTYFVPNHFEDHWVVEYWDDQAARWIMVDSQLDALQRRVLQIRFDPLDVTPGRFITGGKAWQMCRKGNADADKFGIADMHGLWFVRGDHVRDFAALNKVELLPWDGWGLIDKTDPDMSEAENMRLDCAAEFALADNESFQAMRALYETDAGLRVPGIIKTYVEGGEQTVDLRQYETAV